MTSLNLYELKLGKSKYLIHCDVPATNIEILQRCKMLYPYIREYTDTDIRLTTITTLRTFIEYRCDNFIVESGKYNLPELANQLFSEELLLVDYYVKKYMLRYGIDNVHGGSYIAHGCLQTELEFHKVLNRQMIILEKVHAHIDELHDNTDKIGYIQSRMSDFNNLKQTIEMCSFIDIDAIDESIQWLSKYIQDTTINITRLDNLRKIDTFLSLTKNTKIQSCQIQRNVPPRDNDHDDIISAEILFNKIQDSLSGGTYCDKKYALDMCSKYHHLYYNFRNFIDDVKFEISIFPDQFEEICGMLSHFFSQKVV